MTHSAVDDFLEYELRLAVNPADLARLRRLPILTRLAQGRGRTQHLKTVYFDTSNDTLRKRKTGLRVRSIGKQRIQCLKASAGDKVGGIARREYEQAIAGDTPQLDQFPQEDVKQILKGLDQADLTPRFETRITRRTRSLRTTDDDIIELAIDEGNIIPFFDDSMQIKPVCEIELELKAGNPVALFNLALELHQKIPLHILHESKAERGYRLITPVNEVKSPVSRSVTLDSNVSVESALKIIMHSCLAHWGESEGVLLSSDDPEGVHQLRVALRRINSVLRLYGPLLPHEQVKGLRQELKWLMNLAGNARDLDVFLDESLKPVSKHLHEHVGLVELQELVMDRRNQAYRDLRDAVHSARYTKMLLEIWQWLEGCEWRRQPLDETTARLFSPLRSLVNRWLQQLYTQTMRRGQKFSKMSARKRHKLRLDVKHFRYATEFFGSLYGKKSKPFLKKLKALQTLLGELNDTASARSILSGQEFDPDAGVQQGELYTAAGIILGWRLCESQYIEKSAGKSWAEFRDCKPFWGG